MFFSILQHIQNHSNRTISFQILIIEKNPKFLRVPPFENNWRNIPEHWNQHVPTGLEVKSGRSDSEGITYPAVHEKAKDQNALA